MNTNKFIAVTASKQYNLSPNKFPKCERGVKKMFTFGQNSSFLCLPYDQMIKFMCSMALASKSK